MYYGKVDVERILRGTIRWSARNLRILALRDVKPVSGQMALGIELSMFLPFFRESSIVP